MYDRKTVSVGEEALLSAMPQTSRPRIQKFTYAGSAQMVSEKSVMLPVLESWALTRRVVARKAVKAAGMAQVFMKIVGR